MNSYSELWDMVKEYCKSNINETAYNMWIKDLELIKIDAERVIISTARFKINVTMEKYRQLIEEAFYKVKASGHAEKVLGCVL